jgi:aspartokinase-like uncharacterized kinase
LTARLERLGPVTAVVKLGGSLAAGDDIRSWLSALAQQAARRCILVPGGGGFADTVRSMQARHGFSDRAAHRMALMAMAQYAIMLADLEPILMPCATEHALRDALDAGRLPIWLPDEMVLADPAIPEDWRVTSDSLAAWLAQRVGARRLVLIKSAPPPPPPLSPARLATLGLVDPAFPGFTTGRVFDIAYLGPGDEHRLAAALAGG